MIPHSMTHLHGVLWLTYAVRRFRDFGVYAWREDKKWFCLEPFTRNYVEDNLEQCCVEWNTHLKYMYVTMGTTIHYVLFCCALICTCQWVSLFSHMKFPAPIIQFHAHLVTDAGTFITVQVLQGSPLVIVLRWLTMKARSHALAPGHPPIGHFLRGTITIAFPCSYMNHID